jgi:hypothetical protein
VFHQNSKVRLSIDKSFLDFEFQKYKIEPLWDIAITFKSKKAIEVPFSTNGIIKIPFENFNNLKIRGRQRLLLREKGNKIIGTLITYQPNENFIGNIKDINIENFKSKSFNGKVIFEELDNEIMYYCYFKNGKLSKTEKYKKKNNVRNLKVSGGYWAEVQQCNWVETGYIDSNTGEYVYVSSYLDCQNIWIWVETENNEPPYDPYDCNNDPSWPWCNNGNGGGGGSNFGDDASSPGQKPIAEYVNDKCGGAVGMWNMGLQNNNHEVYGVLTQDGSLLITQISPNSTGGQFDGLYSQNGTTYYWYPANGNPTPQYAGTITSGNKYFIPISATIHTHTPCVNDGTDGITGRDGADDFPFASQFSGINHFVLGCNGGTAQYNSSSYFNHQTGNHSSTCNIIH